MAATKNLLLIALLTSAYSAQAGVTVTSSSTSSSSVGTVSLTDTGANSSAINNTINYGEWCEYQQCDYLHIGGSADLSYDSNSSSGYLQAFAYTEADSYSLAGEIPAVDAEVTSSASLSFTLSQPKELFLDWDATNSTGAQIDYASSLNCGGASTHTINATLTGDSYWAMNTVAVGTSVAGGPSASYPIYNGSDASDTDSQTILLQPGSYTLEVVVQGYSENAFNTGQLDYMLTSSWGIIDINFHFSDP
ncbi:MAG: hypothetical protein AAGH99_02460 [Planctomycetota bacterium]